MECYLAMNPSLDSISNYFAEFMSFRIFPTIFLIVEQYTAYLFIQLTNTSYCAVVSILRGALPVNAVGKQMGSHILAKPPIICLASRMLIGRINL